MNNVICAMAKNENKYINDWCKYHLNLGFSHIYIYDNNDSTTPNVLNFIDEEIKPRITVFNVNDIHKQCFQNDCYNQFYKANMTKFDWCAFIDIDEFIRLKNFTNVNDFLSQSIFDDYEVIRLKWHIFGDDDIIERDESIPVYKFFKKYLWQNKLNCQCKSIIRGNILDLKIVSSHYARKLDNSLPKQCHPDGKSTNCEINEKLQYNHVAWINHYMTKTLKEFLEQKFNRTDCQFEKRKLNLDYFWNINNKTKEKENYIKLWNM